MANYSGTSGDDSYWGGQEADHIEGLAGRDYLLGNGGDDEIFGGDGDDNLHGGEGHDLLDGGAGDDLLHGDSGTNTLRGMDGNDRLVVLSPPAGGTFDGGDGEDTFQFQGGSSTPLTFSLADPSAAQNVYGATVVNVERVYFVSGTGNDDITGGALADSIDGNYGDDRIDGGLGDDLLSGGGGTDTVRGGGGNDTLYGSGGDSMYGEDGDDTIHWGGSVLIDGGAGTDLLRIESYGSAGLTVDVSDPNVETTMQGTRIVGIERLYVFSGSGNDRIAGGIGKDEISGNGGHDILLGGGGDDILSGADGNDELSGGAGDDYLLDISGDSNPTDRFDGGDGFDFLEFRANWATGPITIDLLAATGMVVNVERITFTAGLAVTGAAAYNVAGADALDIMMGGTGGDRFEGRGGDDDLRGNGGNDVLIGGDGKDLLIGGQGSDQLYGGEGDDSLQGGSEGSHLDGGAGSDSLFAFAGADVLIGGEGDDRLNGGGGADVMTGGAGNDTYQVDTAGDSIAENADEGVDEVQTSLANYILPADFEKLTATPLGNSTLARDFRGNAGDNQIWGAAGNDILRLNDGGDDVARGFNGNDIFYFGAAMTGADMVNGGSGRDAIVLQGNYSLTLSEMSLFFIESISIQSGANAFFGDTANNLYDTNLTTADGNVAAGQQMIVNAQSLRIGEDFTFDGSAETDGTFLIYGGHGVDDLTGGAGADVFFFEGQRWGPEDKVDGGAGRDSMVISAGSGLAHIAFGADSIANIESISLNNHFASDPTQKPSYELVLHNGNVAPGGTLIVNGNSIPIGQVVNIDGSAVHDGNLILFAGGGHDVLTGGSGADLLFGGGGADALTGGAGADTFRYDSTSDSSGGLHDVIGDFQTGLDKIDLSRIDADTHSAGNQAFSWIGTGAFSGVAGQLRAFSDDGYQRIEGDTDGDGTADLVIVLQIGTAPIAQGDFLP